MGVICTPSFTILLVSFSRVTILAILSKEKVTSLFEELFCVSEIRERITFTPALSFMIVEHKGHVKDICG